MSKNTLKIGKFATLAAASKLAFQAGTASAEVDLDTTGGKLQTFGEEVSDEAQRGMNELRVDIMCLPIDTCSIPTDRFVGDFDEDEYSGGKFGETDAGGMDEGGDAGGKTAVSEPVNDVQAFAPNGIIFAGDVDDFDGQAVRPKMDFIVSGLRNDVALDVFLMYNSAEAAPGENDAFGFRAGSLALPIEGINFITGVHLKPIGPALSTGGAELSSPLGEPERNVRSAILSVSLADLTDAVNNGDLPSELHFQVVAFPVFDPENPEVSLGDAQASDPEFFIIDVPQFDDQGGLIDSGTKGGTYSEQQSTGGDTGSKTTGTTGGSTGTGTGGDTGGTTGGKR